MIDIDIVLKSLAEKAGKRKGDLKRSYNSILKKKEAEGLVGLIPEDTLQRIVLIGVSNKIGLDPEDLDAIIDIYNAPATEEITEEELDDEPETDLELFDEDDELEVEFEDDDDDDVSFGEFDDVDEMGKEFAPEHSWEDIFADTPEPKAGEFERLESLLVMPGVEYTLTLVDPNEMPYKHEGIGKKDNKPFISRAMDVILVDLSPIRKFKEKYEQGDNRGNLCFVKEKKYKLWLSKVAFEWFARFWRELGQKSPDDRQWTYEKVKKTNVTKHLFGEV